MTLGGWISMILSVTSVSIFFLYSLYLLLTRETKEEPHVHSLLENTPDMKED